MSIIGFGHTKIQITNKRRSSTYAKPLSSYVNVTYYRPKPF